MIRQRHSRDRYAPIRRWRNTAARATSTTRPTSRVPHRHHDSVRTARIVDGRLIAPGLSTSRGPGNVVSRLELTRRGNGFSYVGDDWLGSWAPSVSGSWND